MSLILGCWQYDNSFQLNQKMRDMYNAIQLLPHKINNFLTHQQVAFAQMLTYNTPEAIYEQLPVFLSERQILFTAQGRIDNRVELARKLDIKIGYNYADGKLMLQSYLKWGKECTQHLRGDWSFAVFDFKDQELYIARDQMGYTALYYYQDSTGFYFSSSIKSLLALSNYNKIINEVHFVRQLTLWDDTIAKQDTYFQNIFSLPTAYTLSVKNKKIVQSKYWHPEQISLQYRKNSQDYIDEMLHFFTSAVQKRLRNNMPVASMLSGGLDSSAVSYVAADLLKSINQPLTTLSHVPLFKEKLLNDEENQRRILDETPMIMEVVKASGNINPLLLTSEKFSVLRGLTTTIKICDAPSHGAVNLYWLYDIYQTVAEKEYGILLSGEGGNGSISFAGLDYLLPFKLGNFTRHPYQFVRTQIVKRIAKTYFREYLNKRKSIESSLEKYVSNIFINQGILDKYGVLEDISTNKKEFHGNHSSIQKIKEQFTDLYYPRSSRGAACGHYFGFELRDPCTDVDLLEYFFSIPNEVFFDKNYNNRMLVKRMMRGKLPDSILFEKRKGLQSADIFYRVKAQATEILATIEIIKQSAIVNYYIDVRKLSETLQSYLCRANVKPYRIQHLLKALQFALFLHTNFD